MKYICVYCGSSMGAEPIYKESAIELGKLLASKNIGLVYGGASVGTMGIIADTVLAEGGEVIGIMPQALVDKEVSHSGLSELRVVSSMHERKALMCELSDGFIALPGGFGTLDEIFEMLTWAQLGFHDKPCGLLNKNQYFKYLILFLRNAVDQAFIKPIHKEMLLVSEEASELLELMSTYKSPLGDKWINKK